MKYNIKKNWIATFDLIVQKPIVILPFITIAFFEGLALELAYFATRRPISLAANPIIRKFFGEAFLHYPGHLLILGRLFYFAQLAIYIFLGVFLTAISINMIKNIRAGLPLKTNALIKNALNRYFSFVIYGLIIAGSIFLLQKADYFAFSKLTRFVAKYLPHIAPIVYNLGFTLTLFFSNIILQIFLLMAIPLIVIEKRTLLKALAGSVALGFRNFFTIFSLLFLPFLVYLPMMVLKSASAQLIY